MRIKILIVEDNPPDAYLIRYLLEDSPIDYDFSIAENLSAAIKLLQEQKFSLILTDLTLPDSEEHETVNNLTQFSTGIPIIVFTGSTNSNIEANAKAAGATHCIKKGELSAEALETLISPLLAKAI